MEQADKINEYGAAKDRSIDDYRQRLENFPNNKISILPRNKYCERASLKYDDPEYFQYDKIDRYKGLILEERATRNPQQSLKFNNEADYEPKTKILDPIEPGIKPLPLKSKKTQKIRKRSKLAKDDAKSTIPLKSRSQKVAASSATSTPINGQESTAGTTDQSLNTNG